MASVFSLLLAASLLPAILFYAIGLLVIGRLKLSLVAKIGGIPLAVIFSAVLALILAPTPSVESAVENTLVLGALSGALAALVFVGLIGKRDDRPSTSMNQKDLIAPENNDEEWRILAEYDDNVRDAIDLLRPFGESALSELRTAYKVIGDKTAIPRISVTIAEKFHAKANQEQIEKSPEFLMKKYGIDFTAGKYTYLDYRYDRLEDAVAYAQKHRDGK